MRQIISNTRITKCLLLVTCTLIMSGCAWSDAGKLLYSSAVSQQKFNCENDKVGTSIQRCKADIDKNINEAKNRQEQMNSKPETEGYEPKDFVKKQLNRATHSTQ